MTHDNAEALNRLLDDLAYGAVVGGEDLDPDLLATVRWFRDLGAEPLPDPAFRTRLEHQIMSQLVLAPAAGLPASVPHPSPPGLERSRISPATSLPARLPRWRWASARVAAGLLLVAFGLAYLALGPLRPGSDRPHTIPAAVAPVGTPDAAASPAATYIPRADHLLIGTWRLDNNPGRGPQNFWVISFAENGTVQLADGFPRLNYGTWRATEPRTAEAAFILQGVGTQDLFDSGQTVQGYQLDARMEVWHITITIDEPGNTLSITGQWEEYRNGECSPNPVEPYEGMGIRMVIDPSAVTPTPTS